jgi:uncharacterized protein (TIGR02453 family)
MNLEHLTQFLIELKFNNSKTWFDTHRDEYQALKLEFIAFVEDLIKKTAMFDSSINGINAKDTLFRINRDTRFSNNKDPYKTHFSAALASGGRHSNLPIYYVQIGADDSFVAGGVYMPEAAQLAALRRYIDVHPKKANSLLGNKTLLEHFDGLDEEHLLSRWPKGFSEGSELLKYKSFTVSRAFDALEFKGDALQNHVVSSFEQMQPLHKWLREALTFATD